jgi:hypothetical protein
MGVAVPAPWLRPPQKLAPGRIMSWLVPNSLMRFSTCFLAPSEMDTITMTAAIPMMIPSMVRKLRVLFRRSAPYAIPRVSESVILPFSR